MLAWQLGRTEPRDWDNVRRSADFLVARGPRTDQERWENIGGFSPATIAAEIAGLVCAADIARHNGAPGMADRYLEVADRWQPGLEGWTLTRGPTAASGSPSIRGRARRWDAAGRCSPESAASTRWPPGAGAAVPGHDGARRRGSGGQVIADQVWDHQPVETPQVVACRCRTTLCRPEGRGSLDRGERI